MAGLGVIIPAAVAGIGAIASGVSNLVSQADTNNTNWAIHQSQLAYAREQYEREKAENRYLIQNQRDYESTLRAYNSPEQESQRLLAAGINPVLAKYGGLGSSQATSSVGVGSPAKMTIPDAPQMSPLRYDFISQAANEANRAFADSQMQEAQISALKQRLDNESAETLARIDNMGSQSENTRAATEAIREDVAYNRESHSARIFTIKKQNKLLDAQERKVSAEASYQEMVNDFRPTEQRALTRAWNDAHKEILSKINLNYASANAADAAAAYNIALKELSQAQKDGVQIDNTQKSAMAEAIVDAAYSEADEKYWNSEEARVNAGSTSVGVSTRGISIRNGSERAYDPEYRRVRRDSKGRMYIYDNKDNKRIYIENPK